ncbi:MAG: nicotinate-nucleotide adenylyltransferase [Vicinamibacterales bacterium]
MKLGLLGGTFDPVHHGHVSAARAARESLALDRVLFIPSNLPPHRQRAPLASAFDRFAMIALAVDGEPAFEASDLELSRPGASFSIDTLHALHREGWQPMQLFFITGIDAFADIRTWKGFPELLAAAHFVAVTRPGYKPGVLTTSLPDLASRLVDASLLARQTGTTPTRITLIEAETADVSSTDLRRRLASRESLEGLVPDAVERYIHKHRLYLGHPQASPLHG